MAYRVYVTDVLRRINENTATFCGGKYISKRYADIVRKPKEKDKPDQSGKEIANDIISRLTQKG